MATLKPTNLNPMTPPGVSAQPTGSPTSTPVAFPAAKPVATPSTASQTTKDIQMSLNERNKNVPGYVPLKVDGIYGPLTQAARALADRNSLANLSQGNSLQPNTPPPMDGSLNPQTAPGPEAQPLYDPGEVIIQDGPYKGLTMNQANAKKMQQNATTSENTSYTFNPASISGANDSIKKFNLSLNEINNSPFSSTQSKKEKQNSILDITASDIAKGFSTAQDFYTTYQNNPELQNIIKPFIDNGGTIATVAAKIKPMNATTTTAPQDTAAYLASLTNVDPNSTLTDFQKKALEVLGPENKLVQEEIARQTGIAKEYRDYYFGTETTIGVLAEQKKIAEDKKALLAEKQTKDTINEKERLQYNIDKNNEDAKIAQAEIEINRQNAKNVLTRTLAKLGALKTTGTAPVALGVLEQKYQQQAQQLKTKLEFANRDLEITSKDKINNIELKAKSDILNVTEDLSKSTQKVNKELLKIKLDTQSKIYSESSKAAQEFRTLSETYRKEAQANADKYNSNFMLLAGKGINLSSIKNLIDANGHVITSKLTNSMFAGKKSGDNSTKNKTNDIATAVLQIRQGISDRGLAGVPPQAYEHYKSQLLKTYGAQAVFDFEKQLAEQGLTIDNVNK